MGHGGANAPGAGKALGIGHGGANAPGMAHGVGKGRGMGHGGANAPGMAHGAGKGSTHGHSSRGNPGHDAFSTRSSHSQNTLQTGESHEGRSLSSRSHSEDSLAQNHTVYTTKADQVAQVDDRGPGKQKGFDDASALSPGLQADLGKALNPETVHSDLDDIATLGLQPSQGLQVDGGAALNLETIHSNLDEIAIPGVQPSPEVQDGSALNPEAVHSDLDETMTLLRLQAGQELQTGRGKSLRAGRQTIVPDIDDTSATAVLPVVEEYRPKGWSTNPELDDDDDKWRSIPYFGILLVFFSWIVQGGLGAIKRKAAGLRFYPNALRLTEFVNRPRTPTLEDRFKPSGTPLPALDKLAAAFSTASERQQEAPHEHTRASLEHFSGDPDVEKVRAKSEHTQEIEERFHTGFDGIGLG
jgi:hypothetical protein